MAPRATRPCSPPGRLSQGCPGRRPASSLSRRAAYGDKPAAPPSNGCVQSSRRSPARGSEPANAGRADNATGGKASVRAALEACAAPDIRTASSPASLSPPRRTPRKTHSQKAPRRSVPSCHPALAPDGRDPPAQTYKSRFTRNVNSHRKLSQLTAAHARRQARAEVEEVRPAGIEPAACGLKDRCSLAPRREPLTTELRARAGMSQAIRDRVERVI